MLNIAATTTARREADLAKLEELCRSELRYCQAVEKRQFVCAVALVMWNLFNLYNLIWGGSGEESVEEEEVSGEGAARSVSIWLVNVEK